jgi:hypothetical protein
MVNSRTLKTIESSKTKTERKPPTMGRMERERELARQRTRRAKVKKLRAKYATTKNEGEKVEILAKAKRISPFVVFEES